MIDIYTEKNDSKDWILQNDLYFNLNTGNEEMSQKEIDLIRPFLGIIILIGGQKYCIPLTSPKKKFENMKSQIDFIKIFDHNSRHPEYSSKIIGILNLNNMIPVNNSVISKVNLKLNPHDTPDKTKRKILMQKQLSWCRDHSDTIINRANKVYSLITDFPDKNRNLTKRCVDFNKLEQILSKYSDD